MANRAYLSVWTSGYSEETMLDQFERLLETVPLSSTRPGFTNLLIRAVSPSESPLVEHDLQGVIAGAADVMILAREYRNADSVYEVEAAWDAWQWDADSTLWHRGAVPLLLICNGDTYDDGVAEREGHFVADIGFEHLLTGHGRLLGSRGESGDAASETPEHPLEEEFLALMARDEYREEYQEKTRANIQQVLAWVRAVEQALPVERYSLWSEGEGNLEARLDEILAVG
jgi:hypothetical protein